jgi:RNA polymerase sigma factor (sigma-70 family)
VSLDRPRQAPPVDATRWFADEVRTHEPVLRGYLRASFPSVRDIDDIVQESYLRIWKARFAHPITSTKSFLFQVARHLAIDTVRRRQLSRENSLGHLEASSVIEERPNAAEALSFQEKACLVAEALSALPSGCREIIVLRKFEHLQQKEVAARLGISERTVQSQLARGMKLCEKYLRRRGVRGIAADGP